MRGFVRTEIKFNKFPQIASQFPERTETAVDKAANMIIEGAAPETPIGDTGFLINSPVIGGSGTNKTVTWAIFYAIYQNGGTRFIAGNFFAEAGVKYAKPGFIKALQEIASEL